MIDQFVRSDDENPELNYIFKYNDNVFIQTRQDTPAADVNPYRYFMHETGHIVLASNMDLLDRFLRSLRANFDQVVMAYMLKKVPTLGVRRLIQKLKMGDQPMREILKSGEHNSRELAEALLFFGELFTTLLGYQTDTLLDDNLLTEPWKRNMLKYDWNNIVSDAAMIEGGLNDQEKSIIKKN